MNHKEEQTLEMEALGAIFLDQFQQISDSQCAIEATPNADTFHVSCSLEWAMPETYPEVVPEVSVKPVKGMDDLMCQELKQQLLVSANDMVGGPMIFNLVEVARDWLTERNIAGLGEGSMHAKMKLKEIEKQRELELQQQKEKQLQQQQSKSGVNAQGKKIEGSTPVTLENYLKWMNKLVSEEVRALQESQSKLTGRQLFERGQLRPEEEEVVGGDVEDFDKSLMMEEDVDDLDLLDDEDDDDDDEEA